MAVRPDQPGLSASLRLSAEQNAGSGRRVTSDVTLMPSAVRSQQPPVRQIAQLVKYRYGSRDLLWFGDGVLGCRVFGYARRVRCRQEAVTLGTSVPGSSSLDRTDVEAAARDYIEGWYTGDATRMDRSLHVELVKRTRRDDDPDALREVTRARMVEMTADGGGDGRNADVHIAIDDISDGMAAARVVSPDFVDYLHLVDTSDGWRIAHVLFRNRG